MKRSDYYCFQLAVVVVIVVACHINYLHSECEKSVANYVENSGKCVYTVRGGSGGLGRKLICLCLQIVNLHSIDTDHANCSCIA